MDNKQKLSYMVLGAVIMAVGIGLGAVVSPPLIAQRNGVFDEIRCKILTTVDEKGNELVTVGNGIMIRTPSSKAEIMLSTHRVEDKDVAIWARDRNGNFVMQVVSSESGNFINLMNKIGERRIILGSTVNIPGYIAVRDGANKIKWFAPKNIP